MYIDARDRHCQILLLILSELKGINLFNFYKLKIIEKQKGILMISCEKFN